MRLRCCPHNRRLELLKASALMLCLRMQTIRYVYVCIVVSVLLCVVCIICGVRYMLLVVYTCVCFCACAYIID